MGACTVFGAGGRDPRRANPSGLFQADRFMFAAHSVGQFTAERDETAYSVRHFYG
jgi:hypothetical protein